MLLLTPDNGTVDTKKYANITQSCSAVFLCKLTVTEGILNSQKATVLPRHHHLGMRQELHRNIAVNSIL
jgi:hypothetical protein